MSIMVIDKLSTLLQKNKIVFSRKDYTTGTILEIPYNITNKNTKINIEILSLSDDDSYMIGFSKIIIEDDIDEVYTELLDINASLLHGRLSVKKSTKEVNYSMTVPVSENDELGIQEYRKRLQYCFFVYFMLCDNGIIEKEAYIENVEV